MLQETIKAFSKEWWRWWWTFKWGPNKMELSKFFFSKTPPLNVCSLEDNCHSHSDLCTINFGFQMYTIISSLPEERRRLSMPLSSDHTCHDKGEEFPSWSMDSTAVLNLERDKHRLYTLLEHVAKDHCTNICWICKMLTECLPSSLAVVPLESSIYLYLGCFWL